MEIGKLYYVVVSDGLAFAEFTSRLTLITAAGTNKETYHFINGVSVNGVGYDGSITEVINGTS